MNSYLIGLGLGTVILFVVFYNRIRKAILIAFGGSIDKVELGGIIFTIYLGYMIREEALRKDLSHHVYNELYIFFVAGAAMTGLGLSKVLDTIRDIKSVNQNNSNDEPKKDITE